MRFRVLATAVCVVAATGCSDPATRRVAGPNAELVDPDLRLDSALVNAHTYGSFVIPFAGGPVAIRSGPANFPGNPPGGPGTCLDGMWINSRGKPTAGTLEHPHPHCTSAGSAITVVLEPISSRAYDPLVACPKGGVCHYLFFTDPKANDLDVQFLPGIKGSTADTDGDGIIVAYAIDAGTLNGANVRVGTLTIDLNQYDETSVDLFGTCTLDDTNDYQCLPRLVEATYAPLAVGGVGTAATVTGFLWWVPASVPYNY